MAQDAEEGKYANIPCPRHKQSRTEIWKKKLSTPASALHPPHVLSGQRKEIQAEEADVVRATQQRTKKQPTFFSHRKTPGKTPESSVQPQGPEEGYRGAVQCCSPGQTWKFPALQLQKKGRNFLAKAGFRYRILWHRILWMLKKKKKNLQWKKSSAKF